jgi:OOP family OmpA-OmpF porin
MRKSIFTTTTIAVLTLTANFLFAQDDVEGCKDHQFLNRMPNFRLTYCSENYSEDEVVVGDQKKQLIEGTIFNYQYYMDEGKFPSSFQVIKNYENAILAKGGQKIYSSGKHDLDGFVGATFKLANEGNTYWITLHNLSGIEELSGYNLKVIKIEGMKQEITANEMFEKVNSGNSLSLYINFDTGKSTIKSESQNIIDELYTMLKNNPTLKVTIEGHTDNVGNSASNKTLSEQRAASVKTALANKGIAADRIKTIGYGQEKPIADNSTEEGKAKNRRVEIKKQQ